MSNADIYEILEKLNMVEDDLSMLPDISNKDYFEKYTCKDIVEVLSFVDLLFLSNDNNTIKQFLTALFLKNSGVE